MGSSLGGGCPPFRNRVNRASPPVEHARRASAPQVQRAARPRQDYAGKYQYDGVTGRCRLSWDRQNFVVAPSDRPAIRFDLGDVDRITPGEQTLAFKLYTGRTVLLKDFGAAFGEMREALIVDWRDRTEHCLLLEDLEEVERCEAAVNGVPAEVRLYRGNLALLPLGSEATQLRLADVDEVSPDAAGSGIVVHAASRRVAISGPGQRIDDFREALDETLRDLRARTEEGLRQLFPFLDAEQTRRFLAAGAEGWSLAESELAAIDRRLPGAMIRSAVDVEVRRYFEELQRRSTGEWRAGVDFGPGEGSRPPVVWFFLPVGGKLAWLATGGAPQATYFFRGNASIAQLTRGLALVKFQGTVIHLSDESLEGRPEHRTAAIGARKLGDLRAARAAYTGRALHSSLHTWTEQVNKLTTLL